MTTSREHTSTDTAATMLAAAAAIAAGTGAYGDVVRFDNDAGFGWTFNTLDITKAAADQSFVAPGALNGSQIYLDYFSDFYPAFSYYTSFTSGSGAEIWNSGFSNRYASPFNAGDQIGPGLMGGAWDQSSTLEFAYTAGYGYYVGYPYYGYYYTYTSGERGLIPNNGSDSYIGVRLTIDGNNHYGWVGVRNYNGYIGVFAWGYETDAGVGIAAGAIPSPGTMGLLAVGAVGALGRKRRAS